jgi:hypothetical protein
MVKGISRQVIVVQSPDRKLFEQAIFILREDASDVTDEQLLKEAKKAARQSSGEHLRLHSGPVWACGGAAVTALVWMLTSLI